MVEPSTGFMEWNMIKLFKVIRKVMHWAGFASDATD